MDRRAGSITTLSEATANTAVLNWADITTRLLMDNDVPMQLGSASSHPELSLRVIRTTPREKPRQTVLKSLTEVEFLFAFTYVNMMCCPTFS